MCWRECLFEGEREREGEKVRGGQPERDREKETKVSRGKRERAQVYEGEVETRGGLASSCACSSAG